MEISQEDLSALLSKVATDAVEATYAAIAAQDAARAAAQAEASEAAKVAEGMSWAFGLFGALSVAELGIVERLEREAFEARPVRMAMFDAGGNYLGATEGAANLIGAADASGLPEWARPPVITYVEWTETHEALHRESLDVAKTALEIVQGQAWAFRLFGALSVAIAVAEALEPRAEPA